MARGQGGTADGVEDDQPTARSGHAGNLGEPADRIDQVWHQTGGEDGVHPAVRKWQAHHVGHDEQRPPISPAPHCLTQQFGGRVDADDDTTSAHRGSHGHEGATGAAADIDDPFARAQVKCSDGVLVGGQIVGEPRLPPRGTRSEVRPGGSERSALGHGRAELKAVSTAVARLGLSAQSRSAHVETSVPLGYLPPAERQHGRQQAVRHAKARYLRKDALRTAHHATGLHVVRGLVPGADEVPRLVHLAVCEVRSKVATAARDREELTVAVADGVPADTGNLSWRKIRRRTDTLFGVHVQSLQESDASDVSGPGVMVALPDWLHRPRQRCARSLSSHQDSLGPMIRSSCEPV
jgi:hypothetical protein